MKARRLLLKIHPLSAAPGKLDLADLLEEVLLSSPPGGATTEQIIKGAASYNRLAEERRKRGAAAGDWVWWIDAETHKTILAQLAFMRWATTSTEVRLIVVAFVRELQELAEEEVPIASPAPVQVDQHSTKEQP